MNAHEQLDFLINMLSPQINVPQSISDKWRLFRALINVREPKPISEKFLSVQNDLLQAIYAKKKLTSIEDLKPVKDNLYLWQGDITTLKVDAIVNAANSGMLGCFVPCHACIDNAIHTYAGVQLRAECAEIMEKQGHPEPTGCAKITTAYNLPCKTILHTVGPIVNGGLTEKHCKQLYSCYQSCLTLAKDKGITSIAFCCISTGEFHFPNREAAEIAITAVTDFQNHNKDMKVIFNVFKDTDYDIYRELLG